MGPLEGEGAVVAGRLHRPSRGGDLRQGRGDEGTVDAHRPTVPVRLGTVGAVVDERAVVVARRAAEMARRGGRRPARTTSRLWSLAGGRPAGRLGPRASPEELGRLLEASLDAAERRRRGRPLHAERAGRAAGRPARWPGTTRPSVGDPACGGGALLLAAARHLAATGEAPARRSSSRLWGADIDPVAVATTEAALTLWARCASSPGAAHRGRRVCWTAWAGRRSTSWWATRRSSRPLGAHAARTRDAAERLRGPVRSTPCAPTRTSRACSCCAAASSPRPGGTVAMVQPQSVLAARDAARRARRRSAASGGWSTSWSRPTPASMPPSRSACRSSRSARRRRRAAWSTHLAVAHGVPPVDLGRRAHARRRGDDDRGVPQRVLRHGRPRARAARPAVGRPLVTTGLVDLGHCAWGERPARIGGRAWERPVLDVAALEGRAADWVRRTGGPKLVVATQTKVVEVVVDDDGRVDRRRAAGGGPGAAGSAVAAGRRAGRAGRDRLAAGIGRRGPALTPRSLKVTRRAAARGAAPHRRRRLGARHGGLPRRRPRAASPTAMSAAYGTGPDVAAWWIERARTVWSPSAARR